MWMWASQIRTLIFEHPYLYPQIYEFFYNVLISAADLLPAEYLDVIRNMFRCVRSRPYFVQSAVWRKMVGLRQ